MSSRNRRYKLLLQWGTAQPEYHLQTTNALRNPGSNAFSDFFGIERGVGDGTAGLSARQVWSRNSVLRTLPVALRGNAARNVTFFGTL